MKHTSTSSITIESLEWSPHVSTQRPKEEDEASSNNNHDDQPPAIVPERDPSSSPPRRRVSNDSSSIPSAATENERHDDCCSFLDDPIISFQALSLHQQTKENEHEEEHSSSSRGSSAVNAAESKAIIMTGSSNRRRIVKAVVPKRQSLANTDSKLERQEESLSSSAAAAGTKPQLWDGLRTISDSSSIGSCAIESDLPSTSCLPPPRTTSPFASSIDCGNTLPPPLSLDRVACDKLARSKRQRGGSDFMMSIGNDGTSISVDSRKKRRINRNNALDAQEFDSILSQINAATAVRL